MLVALTNLRLSWLAAHLLPLLTDATIKGSCILLVLTVIIAAFRRMSAATRYCLWFLGAMSLLLLPVLQAVVPAWHVLPRWPSHPVADRGRGIDHGTPLAIDAIAEESGDPATLHPALVLTTPVASASPGPTTPAVQRHPLPSPAVLFFIAWLSGVGVCLGRLGLASLSLRRLRSCSTDVRDGEWVRLLERLRQEIGFHRSITMLTSSARMMPMTWGQWRTWIFLPAESVHWPVQKRRAVLLHELSHAVRLDCLTQLVANLAFATQWYNPLVWLARHQLQIERERACDDRVISGGLKPSMYAEQLVQIVSATTLLRRNAGALFVARRSGLEPRLRAILDPNRNRRGVTPIATIATFCLMAAMSLPLALARDGEPSAAAIATPAATQPAATQPVTAPTALTGAAELYVRASKAIYVDCPGSSNAPFGGGYFPYSSAWTELARASFVQNADARDLAHQARLIKETDWAIAPNSAPDTNGPAERDFIKNVLNPMRRVAEVLADAASYQHLQGDDAGAVETIKDLLWMATLTRQQPEGHRVLLRRLVANGFDALACSRMMMIAAWGSYTKDPADSRSLQYGVAQDLIRQLLDQKDPDTQMREFTQRNPKEIESPTSALRIREQFARNSTERCFLATSLACHLYRFDQQKWPQTLDQLVPAYLPFQPIDPWGDGKQTLGYVLIKDGLYPQYWNEPKDPAYHGLDRPLVYSRCMSRSGLAYLAETPVYDFDGGADSTTRVHRHGGQFRDIAGWIPDIYPPDGPTTRPVP